MIKELEDDIQKKEVQEGVDRTEEIESLNVEVEILNAETVSEDKENGKKLPAGSTEMNWKHPK